MSNDSKEKILQAAMALFAEQGYHDTSMSSIAKKAGLAKGTLYWHFNSKEELFKQLISKKGKGLFNHLEMLTTETGSPESIIKQFIYHKLNFMYEHRELSIILFNNDHCKDEEFMLQLINQHKELVNKLTNVIEKGRQDGRFQFSGQSKDVAIAILGMVNGMHHTIVLNQKNELKVDVDQKVELIYQMVMNGIMD